MLKPEIAVRDRQLCPEGGAFTIGPMGDATGGPTANFTHHFLIAMPAMADPHFSHTLTYVCEHNADGALGIVVNKPTDMTLSALFEQIDVPLVDAELRRTPVHFGGPVQVDRGFVLHRPLGNWQSTLAVDAEVGLTTSKDVLEAVARGEGPRELIVSLGYAGWSAGQLEQEIAQNAWLTVAADPGVLFETPVEARLPAAMRLLGIDFSRLSDAVGHA
jgi:putative transcriptional regulator